MERGKGIWSGGRRVWSGGTGVGKGGGRSNIRGNASSPHGRPSGSTAGPRSRRDSDAAIGEDTHPCAIPPAARRGRLNTLRPSSTFKKSI